MPKINPSEAERMAEKVKEARLRFVLRNPEFQKEFRALRMLKNPSIKELVYFERKWGICYEEALYPKLPELNSDTIPVFEEFFINSSWLDSMPPIVTLGPHLWAGRDPEHENYSPTYFLDITVNLRYPLYVLLALIESDLKDAYRGVVEENQAKHSSSASQPTKKKRRRLDTIDFQLTVYNQANQGKKFKEISQSLKKPISTIKSLCIAALQNIYGSSSKPKKKKIPLQDFDPETHVATCVQCNNAQSFMEFCAKAQCYGAQDHGSQKDLLN